MFESKKIVLASSFIVLSSGFGVEQYAAQAESIYPSLSIVWNNIHQNGTPGENGGDNHAPGGNGGNGGNNYTPGGYGGRGGNGGNNYGPGGHPGKGGSGGPNYAPGGHAGANGNDGHDYSSFVKKVNFLV